MQFRNGTGESDRDFPGPHYLTAGNCHDSALIRLDIGTPLQSRAVRPGWQFDRFSQYPMEVIRVRMAASGSMAEQVWETTAAAARQVLEESHTPG
jgi:hypothetical protein